LDLSIPTNSIPTRYSDIEREANSVIDLIFLRSGSNKLNNHSIHPKWHLISDYALLTVTIPFAEENVNSSRLSILKNSEEETAFVKEITIIIKNLDTSSLSDYNKLEDVVNLLKSKIDQTWVKNAK